MPVTMSAIQAGLQVGKGAYEAISGGIAERKAKKEAAHLEQTRPKASISGQIKSDLSLAESELAGGISPQAARAYTEQSDKALGTGVSAIQRMGGGANNIADLFGKSLEGANTLAVLQEQTRQQKVQNLVRARQQYAQEEQKVFEFNEWMPWADKAQANAQKMQQAAQMKQKGIGDIFGAGESFVASMGQQKGLEQERNFQKEMMGMYFGGGNKQAPNPLTANGDAVGSFMSNRQGVDPSLIPHNYNYGTYLTQ